MRQPQLEKYRLDSLMDGQPGEPPVDFEVESLAVL